MQHEVMPDDVAQPDVVLVPVEDLEAKAEVLEEMPLEQACHHPHCESEHDDIECWECHESFCYDHLTGCPTCDDSFCPSCAHKFQGLQYCGYCFQNMTNCCACGTVINTEGSETGYCENHSANCCSDCTAPDSLCTQCFVSDDGDGDGDGEDTSDSVASGNRGMRSVAPWEARGIHTAGADYPELPHSEFTHLDACAYWGIDRELSINKAAADFYLLEPVQMNLDCGEIAEPMLMVMAEEARSERVALIKVWDRQLTAYADMAIGGELRYHQAVGNSRHLHGSRYTAWAQWKALRARGGPELLLETAALFREIHGSSVGGERWAIAAELLHSRVTGRISPEQWIDRVFTLQHNGGAFTNKIAWGPDHCESGSDIHETIGPAHSANPPDFETLLEWATPGAAHLFNDWWPVANKNRMRWRITPWRRRNRQLEGQLRSFRLLFRHFVLRCCGSGPTTNELFAEWDSAPEIYATRFATFHTVFTTMVNHGVACRWHRLDPADGRRLIHEILDRDIPAPMMHTLHDTHPAYVNWVCTDLVRAGAYGTTVIKDLISRGLHVPAHYLHDAGLGPSQLNLLDVY